MKRINWQYGSENSKREKKKKHLYQYSSLIASLRTRANFFTYNIIKSRRLILHAREHISKVKTERRYFLPRLATQRLNEHETKQRRHADVIARTLSQR